MLWRSVRYNAPGVTDYQLFASHPIHREGEVSPFVRSTRNQLPPAADWAQGKWFKEGMSSEDYLQKTGTAAFLVLHNDTLVYEKYFDGFEEDDLFNSFSMSKVYLSALVGIALEEGLIDSLSQSVADYLDFCQDSSLRQIQIGHLLQMTSGLKSSEGYLNPWATSTKLYYGDQLSNILAKLELAKPPGSSFKYQNISSQLLGMVIAQATGRSLSQYLEEKIWQPLGMEADASWSLHEGTQVEKAFCCLNARARDFARFGQLVLNRGHHKGQQLIPENWLRQSVSIDTVAGSRQRYQNAWYLTAEEEDFYAQGLLGQFTYICPRTRTIIVRLGHSLDYNVPWYDNFKILASLKTKPVPTPFHKRDLKKFAGNYVFGLSNLADTSLVGKVAQFRARRKGLRIRTEFGKNWWALPNSDTTFFNVKYGRNLYFRPDSSGKMGAHWERRGNSWDLSKQTEE